MYLSSACASPELVLCIATGKNSGAAVNNILHNAPQQRRFGLGWCSIQCYVIFSGRDIASSVAIYYQKCSDWKWEMLQIIRLWLRREKSYIENITITVVLCSEMSSQFSSYESMWYVDHHIHHPWHGLSYVANEDLHINFSDFNFRPSYSVLTRWLFVAPHLMLIEWPLSGSEIFHSGPLLM